MMSVRFQVGERVKLRTAISVASAGTVGTIHLVYRSVDDLYDVQFDGDAYLKVLRAGELQRADAVL